MAEKDVFDKMRDLYIGIIKMVVPKGHELVVKVEEKVVVPNLMVTDGCYAETHEQWTKRISQPDE